jgi:putative transposase
LRDDAVVKASRFDGELRWLHKVRLYPTCAQERELFTMLRTTRELYNAMLQQRRDAWKTRQISISSKQQYREITELRSCEPRFAAVYRECEDATLRRLDLAMAAFFRRMKRGETPGYPRFKSAHRWNQIEFPHGDRALRLDERQTRVVVPGAGSIRLRKGREVPATFGRVFLVAKNGRWYAVFEAHRAAEPMAPTGRSVGVDRGVRVLAATSDGELIENPRHADRLRERVEQHALALDAATERDAGGRCRNRHDRVRIAAARRLARAKAREANARRDHAHKVSRALIERYDFIALEDLRLTSMTRSAAGTLDEPGRNVAAKSGLNRAMLDAGLGQLATLIGEKAAWAARTVIGVDAKYTSQTCAACGHVAKESRERAHFTCVACHHRDHADVNAARVILLRAESPPTRAPRRMRHDHAHDEGNSQEAHSAR